MTIRYTKGDVTELADSGEFDVLVHGCNCFNTMNSGVALAIATKWPGVRVADNRTERGDMDKLGTYTTYQSFSGLIIVNAYTQYNYGREGACLFNYLAFQSILHELQEYDGLSEFVGKASFLAPKIGSGLAGGDWSLISWMIEHSPLDFTIAEL